MATAIYGPEQYSTAWHVNTRRWRVALLGTAAFWASLVVAIFVLLVPFVPAIVLLICVVIAATLWRARVGLYVALTLAFLFEAGGADALMAPGGYLHGSLQSTVRLPGFITTPFELLMALVFVTWLTRGLVLRQLHFRAGALGWQVFCFFLFLVYGLVRGVLSGGDLNIALWESRFLFYTVVCYVLACNVIRTYGHVRTLNTIMLVAAPLFAAEGAYRKVALIDTGKLGVIPEFAYGHDTVVFLVVPILLVIAQQVYGAPVWQRLLGPIALGICGYTLLATERRAGQIALMVALLALFVVFLRTRRRAFFSIAVPVLLIGAIYLPLFWRASGMLAQPARAVRSLSEPDPRDAASNVYRDLELFNVRGTIHSNPIFGLGFGREFYFIVPLPDLSWWPFWKFEPHHMILWLWIKMGAGGFIAFWVLMGGAIARAGYVAKILKQRDALVFGLTALGGIIATLVFCYVDTGLVSGRLTMLLGTFLGGLAALDRLHE